MHIRLHHLLSTAARQQPDAPALTSGEVTLSYRELWQRTVTAAGHLRECGLRRGDRVGVYLDKRVETVAAIFGTSVAGGVVVPINPLLRPRQVRHILADCEVRLLVTSPERWQRLAPELAEGGSPAQVILVGDGALPDSPGPTLSRWIAEPAGSATPGAAEPASSAPPGDAGLEPVGTDLDPAAIFYTSGSTGAPKGVVVSHRNLLVGADSVSGYLENSPEDVILAALPLSFDAGFSQLTTGFCAGAQVVLHNYLLPGDVVRACLTHQVTGLTAVPPLWIKLTEQQWPPQARQRLRYFANTGGRMPKTVLERLRATFPTARPYLMYGLTEAFRSTYLDPAQVDLRPDSIGKAIPNAEILVVRPDGTLCEPGEPGELVHRGPLVALGYWNDPERTAQRFRPVPGRHPALSTPELAVWSGDTVVRDEAGYLYFVGREDELVKTSGYRVSPTEIEEVAYGSGLVGDAVAFGVDDPALGQHIVLVVTPATGVSLAPATLHSVLKRQLPLYMVPKRIVVREEIPRSPNGKFDRSRLRAEVDQ